MKQRCDKCDGTGVIENPYLGLTVNRDLLEHTPKSVWDSYFENGYTLHQAMAEELSYGEQA